MAKKDTKTTHAAHIKRRTEGTSNELSFSVLDAAKNSVEADAKEGQKATPFLKRIPVISFGLRRKKPIATPTKEEFLPLSEHSAPVSSSGASSDRSMSLAPGSDSVAQGTEGGTRGADATYSLPSEEVLRRKIMRKQKRRSMRLLAIAVAAVVVVAAGILAFMVINTNKHHVEFLSQAFAKINTTNDAITTLNDLVESSTPLSSEDLQMLAVDLDEALVTLDEAGRLVDQSRSGINLPQDKEALEKTQVAIDSRRVMIENGKKLIQARYEKEIGITTIRKAWEDVLNADALAKEAAALVVNTTSGNIESSRQKNEKALALFESSLEAVTEVTAYSIGANFTVTQSYLQKRIDSLKHALASDDALLALNKQEAQAQNEAYNVADSEAANLARQLPNDPTQPIIDAYISSTEAPRTAYTQARAQANTTGSFLRDYFGT